MKKGAAIQARARKLSSPPRIILYKGFRKKNYNDSNKKTNDDILCIARRRGFPQKLEISQKFDE